ncbi:MAG: efflux RND transporter periplasmic adaptor subunit [Acidobacteriota bacterium]|nr:efflux RND transporter periplasmic adaptor subunit [Acidobacteriota bacterium]
MTMPPLNAAVVDITALLLAASDSAARAALVAAAIVEQIPDSACAVHRLSDEDGPATWTALGVAGDLSIEQSSIPPGSRLIAPLLTDFPQTVIYPAARIRREDYAHLHVSRSIASLAYIPLLQEGQLTGALEILTFSAGLQPKDLEEIAPIAQLASPAILAAEAFEQQRQTLLDSVHRMSQLYDLEKSLNSTLELDAVIALIPVKASAMLACQAIHLWLFDGDVLRLVSSSGEDASVEVGMTQAPGEGYVADMAEEGEPLLIADAEDERLSLRNAAAGGDSGIPPITNALLVPLLQDEAEVGVLEAINREDHPFDEDDLFFLVSMAETVSSALKNANLLLAERKLEILKTLVRVSSEITSTLRLDRLLQIIVNSPQNVLPYELCAIALDHHGRLQLKAVSGMSSLPLGDAQVERLHELMRWLSSQSEPLHLFQHEESSEDPNGDLPSAVARHFSETGYRGLYALPLTDDQGRVGLLLYESSEPDFLDLPHTEMIKVLAGQATVAIRNALLYREVPLISLIEPLLKKKQAVLSSRRSRWMTFGLVFECALFLAFCPLPMRVVGDSVVAPQHLVTIAAPVDGNVTSVFAHEGQRVAAGDVLGAINDWQWRTDLNASEAKYQEAMLVMQNDLAHGSAQAGADRAQAEFLRSEVARARSRLDSAKLRSPIAGIVVTPNLQNVAGQHLDAGAPFAQVLDLSTAVLQVSVPERDVALLSPGQTAAIKLDSYPQRTWHGRVAVVSPQAHPGDGERTFTAEVPLPNLDASLRAGMAGRGKIFIGWRPAGYVLLRRPALWIWQTLWDWIGW